MRLGYPAGICALLSLMLSSCGGGGGGSFENASDISTLPTTTITTGTGSPVVATTAATTPGMALTPQQIVATQTVGSSAQVVVTGSLVNPREFGYTAYGYIIDPQGQLTPTATITAASFGNAYNLNFSFPSTLAVGSYQGNYQLQICPDVNCQYEYPGFPVLIPFTLTVTAAN